MTTAATPDDEPNPQHLNLRPADAQLQPQARKFGIGLDGLDLSGLDSKQADDAQWLWDYCRARDLGKADIEGLLVKPNGQPYSYASVYALLTGRRSEAEVSVERICKAIGAFRRQVDSVKPKTGFLETRLFRELETHAKRAQSTGSISIVTGDFALGKTACCQEIARRDPKVIFHRMPTRGHLNHFLRGLCTRLAMGGRQTNLDVAERIIDAFRATPGMLLIIDEADQCFQSVRNNLGMSTLEFVRELWDQAGCGVLLIMDHAGRDALRSVVNTRRMQRLWRRRLPMKQLPPVPYREDLDLFAASFGLPPAGDEQVKVSVRYTDADGEERERTHTDSPLRLQREVLRDKDGGLFVWLEILADARELARAQKRPITWGAVIKAHAAFGAAELEPEGDQ
jgi:DNA transposition AAA+ family ATPase